MATFSRNEKLILELLKEKEMTIDELKNKLGIEYDVLMKELATMLKSKSIEKTGFPTYYRIMNHRIELKEKRVENMTKIHETDNEEIEKLYPIELNIIVEFSVIEENLLKKQLEKYEELLKEEKIFKIKKIDIADIVEEEGRFNTFMEINLLAKDFQALVKLIFFYGPISIEVVKPENYKLSISEMQESLGDMARGVHGYIENIAKLMNERELEKFNESLYK